jgi:hypothetical protein
MKTTEKQTRKYVKPEVLGASQAKTTVQHIQDSKPGDLRDGTEATGPAYEADE